MEFVWDHELLRISWARDVAQSNKTALPPSRSPNRSPETYSPCRLRSELG